MKRSYRPSKDGMTFVYSDGDRFKSVGTYDLARASSQQGVNGNTQEIGQLIEKDQIGAGKPAFPFGYGLWGYAQMISYLDLRQSTGFSQ